MGNVITGRTDRTPGGGGLLNIRGASVERQAYAILHAGFVALPVVAGLDKFAQILTNWDAYLAPSIARMLGGSANAHTFMLVVGVVEIVAGLLVAIRPRIGAYVVAGWLAAIMLNLVIGAHYLDVALRDLGLCLGAIALGRLSQAYDRSRAR